MKEWVKLFLLLAIFLCAYFLPVDSISFQNAAIGSLRMVKDYAQKHILFCLVPALFIAGAIYVFISQASVIKYFGAGANKILAYAIASVSGTILAVCSCTVLPLFAGIYTRGAGIGPAAAFLYSGPAINVLAIILTARILGWELGIARALGSIVFSIIIGLLMSLLFGDSHIVKKEQADSKENFLDKDDNKPLWQNILLFISLIGILIFAAWGKPEESVKFWDNIYSIHWYLTLTFLIILISVLKIWFRKDEIKNWIDATWMFAKQILPLLLVGVMISGFLMGMPNSGKGIIPSKYIQTLVGGNSFLANLTASVVGAFMYFATLTEVPILQGLIGAGMGKGPALALLLAGPALSLPSMIVLQSIMGTKRTITYCLLVIIMATITGLIYGNYFT